MKILYLSSDLQRHDQQFLKALTQKNLSIVLVTYYSKHHIPEQISSLPNLDIIHYPIPTKLNQLLSVFSLKWLLLLCSYLFWNTITRFILLFRYFLPKPWLDLWFSLTYVKENLSFRVKQAQSHFKKILKDIKPDLIHSGWLLTDSFLAALSGFKPLLVMPWGSDVLIYPEKSIIHRYIVTFTIKSSDYITCDCDAVKNKLQTYCHIPDNRFCVFPWGIDLTLFKPNKSKDIRKRLDIENSKVLLMNRVFEPVYGIEYFIRACSEVIKSTTNFRVLLLGDGSLKKELKSLVLELGLTHHISFEGWVNHNKLPAYLNTADLYISSSLSDGSSLSLLEAMACGLPVIVTDIDANLEWVTHGENGYIVPKKSISELAEAIVDLINQPEKAQLMATKNLDITQQKANWNKHLSTLIDLYHKIVTCDT